MPDKYGDPTEAEIEEWEIERAIEAGEEWRIEAALEDQMIEDAIKRDEMMDELERAQ